MAIFIPPSNSWTSFTLLSVQIILSSFPCIGVKMTNIAKPASANKQQSQADNHRDWGGP